MPMKLEIIGDDASALVAEFRRLSELTSRDTISVGALVRALTLNDFITLANERLEADGFMVACRPEAEDPEPQVEVPLEPLPEPKRAKKKTPEPEVVTGPPPSNSNVEEFPAPRRSKPTATPANIESDDDEDPAADRQYVLDTLAGILKDPARKAEVLAFTGEQAKRHGTNKISELPVEPFPSIRREMEKAFPDARSA